MKVNLLDVPFLPLRKLFPKEYGGALPGKFSQLVRAYNVRLDEAVLPEVSFEEDGYHVVINNNNPLCIRKHCWNHTNQETS